jgi:2-desacetyl-2-hydroxyethyl bacteriochlorophyllide A dehydrogenase
MSRELLLTAPRAASLVVYDDPPLEPGQLRARAVVSGVSQGTELNLWRGTASPGLVFDPDLRAVVEAKDGRDWPLRPGYEWVGRVEEVGEGAEAVEPGSLVHLQRPHRETQTFGVADALALPDALEPERATLVHTTAIALQAVHDAEIRLGDRVAVFGLGTFGLLALQIARLSGADWIAAIDPLATRRTLAESLGADRTLDPTAGDVGLELRELTERQGVDVAIEFTGRYDALHQALRSVRRSGTVVASGFYPDTGGEALHLGREFHHNQLTLIASQGGWGNPPRQARWPRQRLRPLATDLLASGRLATDELITHRIPFDRAPEAYELIDARPADVLRAVLVYPDLTGSR